ncbi:MAG TPA: HD domain-containing protein [Acidimicrobiales bacterium]|nr:HD domain-containing protein [Acidimicrobiales bacterium]
MSIVAIADAIAEAAHAGVPDKGGRPYIEHPRAVAALVEGDDARAAALLHDVIEDTDLTEADLLAAGIPVHVVTAVAALTRREGQADVDYYATVAANELALRVKRADIANNTDPVRTARLDPATRDRLARKYAKATKLLDDFSAERFPS